MGVVAYNYIIEDDKITELLKNEYDVEGYLDEQLMAHDYKGIYFERQDILFWTGLKSWCPMYELLKVLDNSFDKVLSRFSDYNYNLIEETATNCRCYYYYSDEVKEIWSELKNISIGDIEVAIVDKLIIDRIKNIQGYWNERIENKESMVKEYFALYKAFYTANNMNRGVLITQG